MDEGAKPETGHEGGQGLGGRVCVQRHRAAILDLALPAGGALQATGDVPAAVFHGLWVVCAVHEALPRQRGRLPPARRYGRGDRQVKGEIGGGLGAHLCGSFLLDEAFEVLHERGLDTGLAVEHPEDV